GCAARRGGRSRDPVARSRRSHQLTGLATLAGVRRRIGQGSDRVEKLHDRSWPAVDEHQWSGIGRRGPHMQKMHGRAVDDGGVLRETVDARLVLAPVITRAPVLRELYEIAERDASFPTDA